MKSILKPLTVILAVAGIYFWGIKGEITTINGKVFNTKGKDSEVARAKSTPRQHVQGQGEDIAVSSASETGVDDPEKIAHTASLDDPILDELIPVEPLTEPETGVDDPEEITHTASLDDPILE